MAQPKVKTRRCKACTRVRVLDDDFYEVRPGYVDTVCKLCRNTRTAVSRKNAADSRLAPVWANGYLRALKRTRQAKEYGVDSVITACVVARVWIAQAGRCAITGTSLTVPPPECAATPTKWVARLPPSKRISAAALVPVHAHGTVMPGDIMFISASIADIYGEESRINEIRNLLTSLASTISTAPAIPCRDAVLVATPLPVSTTHPANIQ